MADYTGTQNASGFIANADDQSTSFRNTSTAGTATIVNTGRGFTEFDDSTSASSATLSNDNGGQTDFLGNSNAGSATISASNGGSVNFVGSSSASASLLNVGNLGSSNVESTLEKSTVNVESGGTLALNGVYLRNFGVYTTASAGSAVITNHGVIYVDSATLASASVTNSEGGILILHSDSIGGSGTLNNSGGVAYFGGYAANITINDYKGGVQFLGTGSAGSSTINISDGAALTFIDTSDAGGATINNMGGAVVRFSDNSNPNQALINNFYGTIDLSTTQGVLDGSGNSTHVLTVGAISGAGVLTLGSNQLTVGGRNISTVYSGSIQDGGQAGGAGASLIKVGTGTLTLSGHNSYSGGTTLSGGILNISTTDALGSGPVVFGAGNQELDLESSALSSGGGALSFSSVIVGFGVGDKIDLDGYDVSQIDLDRSTETLKLSDGTRSLDIHFDPEATLSGFKFLAQPEEAGTTGTQLVLEKASPPVATNDAASLVTGRTLTFAATNLLANDTDADSDTLTVTDVGTASHGQTTYDDHTGIITYQAMTGYVGADSFTYSVIDGNGSVAQGLVDVTVNSAASDKAPVMGAAQKLTTDEDTPVTGQLTATDPDGDDLTYAVVKPVAGLTLDPFGSFSFDPQVGGFNSLAAGATGTVTFQATASDGLLTSKPATETITVTGVNDAPIAVADTVSLSLAGKPVSITGATLLKNDTDPDKGDVLKIASVDGSATQYGSVSLDKSGNVIYTPGTQALALKGAQTLTDTFQYTVQDKLGATSTATATLTLSGKNTAPVVTTATVTGDEDHAITGQLAATDADGDSLIYTLVKPVTGLSLDPSGAFTFDPQAGGFNSLAAGAKGTASFQVTASDGLLASKPATETLTITGVNDAPVAADDAVSLITGGAAVAITAKQLLANDTDPDKGDVLSITGVDATSADGGTLTRNAKTGDLAYTASAATLAAAQNGPVTDTFSYTVVDKSGATSQAQVTLTMKLPNIAPVAVDGTAAVTEGTGPLTGQVSATDANKADILTYKLVKPVAGLVLNPDGSYSFTPDGTLTAGQTGTVSFQFTATDPGKLTSKPGTEVITITGANDAPVAKPDTLAYTLRSGALVTPVATLLKNDVDPDKGDVVSLTAVGAISTLGGSVSLANGKVSYDPGVALVGLGAGKVATDTFTYTVQDKVGAQSTGTVNVTLKGVNDAPSGQDGTATYTDAGHVLAAADFGFTDPDTGDSFGGVKIDTLPTAGKLLLSGKALAKGATVTAADVAAGKLTFVPGFGQTADTSLTFQVEDAGKLFDPTVNTLTLTTGSQPQTPSPVALAIRMVASDISAVSSDTGRTFVFTPAQGQQLVTDFQASGTGHDTLDLSASGLTSFAAVLSHTTMADGSATIHLDPKDSFTLQNVSTAALKAHPNDFVFHA